MLQIVVIVNRELFYNSRIAFCRCARPGPASHARHQQDHVGGAAGVVRILGEGARDAQHHERFVSR